MTGGAVTLLVIELGVAIVRWVVITEEIRTCHTIELNQIARHMGTDGITGNATLLKGGYLGVQFRLVGSILHIAFTLCSCIATLEPVAMGALAWWHGGAYLLHERF